MPELIKVFLVDDEIVIREGIRNSFPWEACGYTLVGEAPDGEIALPMIRDANPDILITDIRMPFMDGMALCRQVKRQMPWIGIVILSGYDDFEYARQAISLGVQEYMLKPISAKEMQQALDRIAVKIRQRRNAQQGIERRRRQMVASNQFLQEKLLSSIFADEMDCDDLQRMSGEMRALGINLVANCYTVVDIAFTQRNGKLARGRQAVCSLAENNGAIYGCTAPHGARALVLGDNWQDTQERAYAFANSAARQLEHIGAEDIIIAIGEIVESFAQVYRSKQSARLTRHAAIKQKRDGVRIVGVREVQDQTSVLTGLDISPLYEQLQYITEAELKDVMARYIASLGVSCVNTPTVAGYLHVEALMTAGRIIRQAGGNPDEIIPQSLLAPDENAQNHHNAVAILRLALGYRAKHVTPGRSLVDKARSYLAQNYTNPNLMLQDVAKQVCMSSSRFSTVFAQETGYTFTEYLMTLRMNKAKELLSATDMRSSQIAFAVGYNDPHYFSYLFKKNIGKTPSEYRKQK